MVRNKGLATIMWLVILSGGAVFAASLEENWNDFLHYTAIGQFELAKGFGEVLVESEPNAVELLALSEDNPQGYLMLVRASERAADANLAGIAGEILRIIERGRFIRRADAGIIAEEIRRLSTTERGRLTAVKRLQDAGEYAIPYMVDALGDGSRKEEWPNIIWALPQIGRGAVRPLTAALQTENTGVKAEIIKALGEIGYPESLGYLKLIVEKDESAELKNLAAESIRQIDPSAANCSAAQLFHRLAESYYYHTESVAPADDANFANIWFWDGAGARLTREKVERGYFYELMAMRACEWSLKGEAEFGAAIGLWLASYFKAESTGLMMPAYFGQGHAEAMVYATTAGAEYAQQSLARALKDKNAYVALGAAEALVATAGEKSVFYPVEACRPLLEALRYEDRAVRYSAAIAVALAGPKESFAESKLVVDNLREALLGNSQTAGQAGDLLDSELATGYAVRAAEAMLAIAENRSGAPGVIDLVPATEALIETTKGDRAELQILAGQVLARLTGADAQKSIAAMAMSEKNGKDVRLAAMEALAVSGKVNGNLLADEQIDEIYGLISDKEADSELRKAAGGAYGALGLPSRKVKDLILDQAKT